MSFLHVRTKRRTAVVAVVAAGALLSGGSAYAFFTTTGSGSGSAQVGLGKTVKSVAVVPSTGLLYPSTSYKGDLRLTLTANGGNARVTGVAQDPNPNRSVTVNGGLGGTPACTGSFVTLSPVTNLSIDLTANTPFTTQLSGVVAMAINAPQSCQGAEFVIPVILTAQETP